MSLIFEKSVEGRRGTHLPKSDVPISCEIDKLYARTTDFKGCELSELDVVRHFTELSRMNYGVDTNFYPLGSCTMKYNPKLHEKIAQLPGFVELHPLLPQLRGGGLLTQGALAVVYELEQLLCEITGMDAFTLHPLAGAHGELTGMMLVAAYHHQKQNKKTEVLIPDEAHGTNPSSATIAGYRVRSVPTHRDTGAIDLTALESEMGEHTAALMLTNPNTLGIFISDIEKISQLARKYDCLLYYDGANLNAVLGRFRPGDAHFDIVHVNLHKTFSTPHGGGGPGAGPIGVLKHLERFLPVSRVIKRDDNTYALKYDYPDTIGYVAPFYGNFGVCLRAYAYILTQGAKGLKRISENAVLNANYLLHSLKDVFEVPYPKGCMHECVLSAVNHLEKGVRALDIAKALIDEGFHPPTVYFPLIIKESLMVEPTETESKETLDAFIEAMKRISKTAETAPQKLHAAPVTTPVGRLDETKAAREMDIRF